MKKTQINLKNGMKKTTKRILKERPRNHGTWTEAMFWGSIRSALRNKSRFWKPVAKCKLLHRRLYKGPNKRQKFEYQCNNCKNWFPEKKVAVDHIIPAGSLKNAQDLPAFVERLFVEIDGLQVLCNDCHSIKTLKDNLKTRNK